MNLHPLKCIHVTGIPPEGIEYTGDITPAELGLVEDDRLTLPNPLVYDLNLSMVSGSLLARGTLSMIARPRCDRCLHYYNLPLEVPDFCQYFEGVSDDVFDLTDSVREDIVLVLPQTLLCNDDCLGLCPNCGQNLNVHRCNCHEEPRGDSVWGELDNLNLDN
jgi:uncharacterized protein